MVRRREPLSRPPQCPLGPAPSAGRLPSARQPGSHRARPAHAGDLENLHCCKHQGSSRGPLRKAAGGLEALRSFHRLAWPRGNALLGRLQSGKRSRPVGSCRCLCTWLLPWGTVAVKACTGGRDERVRGLDPSLVPGESQRHWYLSDETPGPTRKSSRIR